MLRRIQSIKNIGRFVDCHPAGQSFGENTLIFGRNANGKSTLTAIFRSLQEGNTDLIVGRKTFGQKGSQEVKIVFDDNGVNQECQFPSSAWSSGRPDILIFDNQFVSDNIYEGECITFEHQQELHSVLVGSEGREIQKEISKLQEQSDELSNQKRLLGQEFSQKVGDQYNVPLETFLKIEQVENVAAQIEDLDRQIQILTNKQAILNLLNEHIDTLKMIDYQNLKTVLESSISANPTLIQEHITHTWSDPTHTKHFLQEGTSLTKTDKQNCVFCGQELGTAALKLLAAYETFFQQGYEELQRKVSQIKQGFQEFNVEATLRQIMTDLSEQGLDSGLTEQSIEVIAGESAALAREIANKSHNLQHIANPNVVDTFTESVNSIRTKLSELKQGLQEENDEQRLKELKDQKNRLLLSQLRHSVEWIEFCKKVKTNAASAQAVRTNRDAKREELLQYAEKVYSKHKNSINKFLEAMDADFRIKEMKPLRKLTGKSERVFSLAFFDSYEVDIAADSTDSPTFSNTLSDSDKRVLAFAFFLSLVTHDPNIDQKIVIFDDPISSLDDERKRKSIHLLADVGYDTGEGQIKYPKQRIIMTHERTFFVRLHDIDPFDAGISLKIEPDGVHEGKKKSTLNHCNIQNEFLNDDIISFIKELQKVRDENYTITSFQDFTAKCRIVLEHIFKRKYYLYLAEEISSKKSIRTFVERLAEQGVSDFNFDLKKQKFIRLCNSLHIELHDSDTQMSDGDQRSIVRDFFECKNLI